MKNKIFLLVFLSVFSFKSLALGVVDLLVLGTIVSGVAYVPLSMYREDSKVRKSLANELQKLNPVVKAIILNDLDFFKENMNTNVHNTVYDNFPLIHIVSLVGHEDIMNYILELGANPNHPVELGVSKKYLFTPIDLLKYNTAMISQIHHSDARVKSIKKQEAIMTDILEKAGGTHTKAIKKLLKKPEVIVKETRIRYELLILQEIDEILGLKNGKSYKKLVAFSEELSDREKLFLNSVDSRTQTSSNPMGSSSVSKFEDMKKYALKTLNKENQTKEDQANCKKVFN